MSKKLIGQDPAQNHHSEDIFGSLLQEYEVHLQARGYQARTVQAYLESALHFTQWLSEKHTNQSTITAETVRDFFELHLSICGCTHPALQDIKTVRAALNQLLLMRGQDRLRPRHSRASVEVEASIGQFDTYMRDVGGLAQITRWNRCRYARNFLDTLFGPQPLVFDRITPEALIQYVTDQAHHYQPGTVAALAGALRGYLRFLQFNGMIPTYLVEAIPTPPSWSLATLPPSLCGSDLECFWSAFDCSTAIGKRDFAMAHCLADLALRCQEVADMRLDAIDWRAGVLHLPRTKNRRANLLPLPETTGQALVDYLHRGRPTCTSRAVFVYHRAPLGQAVAKTTVRGAIRRAFSRTCLPWSGTHVLRHTAATRMLQAGVSIKEIADVLRHRSIDTTMIYTKVDLPSLACVALPWPERWS